MLLLLVIILGLSLLIWYVKDCKQYNEKLKKFPSPPESFLFGHYPLFLDPRGVLLVLNEIHKQYGDTVRLKIGFDRSDLSTIEYKLIELILPNMQTLNKSHAYKFLYRWLGKGLITNSGDERWKKHRKFLTPAFHFKILEKHIDVYNNAGQYLIKKFEENIGKDSVNIHPLVALYALDVICESAMGTCVGAQEDSESDYVKSVKNMCRILVDRAYSVWKMFDFLYKFSSDYKIEKQSLKILHDYTNIVIKQKLNALKQNKHTPDKNDQKDDVGIKTKKSFLDLLLSEMNLTGMTLEMIREEVDTFMFAGHDTTSSAISFCIWNLAQHQDIQQKVYEEQLSIFGDDFNRPLVYDCLREMKYLELVIKESLRLYPSVPIIARNLNNDLVYDGQILPKGLTISFFIYGLHRNEKYFPNPEKFDPDRFNNIDGSYPYAYIPFSSGPRNCIGQKFAMSEIKSTISILIRKFQFLPSVPSHKLDLRFETTLISRNGINVKIIKR